MELVGAGDETGNGDRFGERVTGSGMDRGSEKGGEKAP
jgi:hypothetical protein